MLFNIPKREPDDINKIIEKYNTPDEAIKAFNKSGRME